EGVIFLVEIEGQRHRKTAALADPALQADIPAHQLGQLARDMEAKPRALLAAGIDVVDALLELLEDQLLLVFRNADSGVPHGDRDHAALAIANIDADAATLGREFHGVREEIDE